MIPFPRHVQQLVCVFMCRCFFGSLGKSHSQQLSTVLPQLAVQCNYSNNGVTPLCRRVKWKEILPPVQREENRWTRSGKREYVRGNCSMDIISFSNTVCRCIFIPFVCQDDGGIWMMVLLSWLILLHQHCPIYGIEVSGIRGSKQLRLRKSKCLC